jgi:succinate dehydrogenase cytochrome b subunit
VASSPVGTLYRGREGMWSWVLHRITGVTLFFFLFAHVVDIAMVRVSPEVFNQAVHTYKNPVVGLMEAGLVAAFLFHALNGIRIVLVDFWEKGPRYQRQMTYGAVGIFVVLFVPFLVRHLTNVFGG